MKMPVLVGRGRSLDEDFLTRERTLTRGSRKSGRKKESNRIVVNECVEVDILVREADRETDYESEE